MILRIMTRNVTLYRNVFMGVVEDTVFVCRTRLSHLCLLFKSLLSHSCDYILIYLVETWVIGSMYMNQPFAEFFFMFLRCGLSI